MQSVSKRIKNIEQINAIICVKDDNIYYRPVKIIKYKSYKYYIYNINVNLISQLYDNLYWVLYNKNLDNEKKIMIDLMADFNDKLNENKCSICKSDQHVSLICSDMKCIICGELSHSYYLCRKMPSKLSVKLSAKLSTT